MCWVGESWWSTLIRQKAPWHRSSSLKSIRAAPSSGKKYFSCKTPFFACFLVFLNFFFFFFFKEKNQVFQIVQDTGQFPSDNRWPKAVLFQPLSIGAGAGAQSPQVSGYFSGADPWQVRDSWFIFQQSSAYAVAVFVFDFPLLITKIGLNIIIIILMIQNNYCNYILFGKLLTQSIPKDPIGLKKGDDAQMLKKTKSLLKKREKQSAN